MDHNILSVDSGNGFTNALFSTKPGKYKTVSFPSVRAAASGDSLGLGVDLEMQYTTVGWEGSRYIVGDDVVTVSKRGLNRLQGIDRYPSEFTSFLTAYAAAQMGVKDGEHELVTYCPPGIYTAQKDKIREYFLTGDHVIKLSTDKKARRWCYNNVLVWPESIAAALAILLDDNGSPVNPEALNGRVLVVDSGAFTLDTVELSDGKFNPENLQVATASDGGLHVHIHQNVLRWLKSNSPDFDLHTVDDIDYAIRNGGMIRAGAGQVDISQKVQAESLRYAGWIADYLKTNFQSLRGIASVILVGGGADFILENLLKREDMGSKVLNTETYKNVKGVHPSFLNALGGYRFRMYQLANG